MVPLLPGTPHGAVRQRDCLQLPVSARPEGGRDHLQGNAEGVGGGVRRGSQHRQRVHRGAQRQREEADARRREEESPSDEPRDRQVDSLLYRLMWMLD